MGNGKWKMAKTYGGFAISHLPFAIQDAFFSILRIPPVRLPTIDTYNYQCEFGRFTNSGAHSTAR